GRCHRNRRRSGRVQRHHHLRQIRLHRHPRRLPRSPKSHRRHSRRHPPRRHRRIQRQPPAPPPPPRRHRPGPSGSHLPRDPRVRILLRKTSLLQKGGRPC